MVMRLRFLLLCLLVTHAPSGLAQTNAPVSYDAVEALLSQQGGSALPAAVDARILELREAAWRSPESRAARAAFRSRR